MRRIRINRGCRDAADAVAALCLAASLLLLSPTVASAQETPAASPATTAYLAAYFCEKKTKDGKEDSQLYYAIAQDGFRFADSVNHNQPLVRASLGDKIIRDPMVLRGPGGSGFHLIGTVSWKGRSLILFDSPDLIHWRNERLVTIAPGNADMTWAPELRWDPESKRYFAYWTSSVDNKWSTAAIWYATSTDLKTFSPPKILMKEQDGCLDADIVYADGKWHMVYRYTGIWMRTAEHAFGPYGDPVHILDLNVEGPFLFPINGRSDQWGLVYDYFGGNQGKWGLSTSEDFHHWTTLTNKDWPYYTPSVFFPPGIRHGSVLPITAQEAEAILAAFGSTTYDENGHAVGHS